MDYKKTKLLVFYLPQFHEIPENNDAWGHGFTEWKNVKNAKKLFLGHYQPHVPFHHNYYNLLDVTVMKWQADLAKKAGIYGFCLYHYWFNGKLVLEQPVENLRRTSCIPMNYCFAWANESWTKTWHGAGGEKEILISQTYGGEDEWERHFNYFLPFFKDKRYIKVTGKPLLLIYNIMKIPNHIEMIRYWNKRAKDEGMSGIYLVCMKVNRSHIARCKDINATVDFEPNKSKNEKLLMKNNLEVKIFAEKEKHKFLKKLWNCFAIKTIDYDKINRTMLKTEHRENEYRCVFINYDDTPRRQWNAIVTKGSNPRKFGHYLKKAWTQAKIENAEFLFINAWNEWGEGNHLEPDEKYGYAYLKQIKRIIKQSKNKGNDC